jgi:hypothetical protein
MTDNDMVAITLHALMSVLIHLSSLRLIDTTGWQQAHIY